MFQLTVRDAQRSARDTEILVTLVRTAAEMRNSFEEMKRLLRETEDEVILEVQRNTDISIAKVLESPRTMPNQHQTPQRRIDDSPVRSRNVFKRALKSLSTKPSGDIAHIEEMLGRLLGEVEELKTSQQRGQAEDAFVPAEPAESGMAAKYRQVEHASPKVVPRVPPKGPDARKESFAAEAGNENQMPSQFEAPTMTGHVSPPKSTQSAPNSPNLAHYARQSPLHAHSIDRVNLPRPNDKVQAKLPKGKNLWARPIAKLSRWSETTASTVARGLRNVGNRNSYGGDADERVELGMSVGSRSGSALAQFDDDLHPHDPYGDDRLGGRTSIPDAINQHRQHHHATDASDDDSTAKLPIQGGQRKGGRIANPDGEPLDRPSTSQTNEPRYQANRTSLLLKQPQPRSAAPTEFHEKLESAAARVFSPGANKSAATSRAGKRSSRNETDASELSWLSRDSREDEEGYGYNYVYGSASAGHGLSAAPPPRPPKESRGSAQPEEWRAQQEQREQQERGPTPPAKYALQSPPREMAGLAERQAVPKRKPTGPRAMTASVEGSPRGSAEV